MKHTQSNIMYHTEFDGAIFKYRLKGLFAVFLPLMGFCKRFELPLNVVLAYEAKRVLFVFQSLNFAIYRYNCLNNVKLKTTKSAPMIFVLSPASSFSKALRNSLDKNIKETKHGSNVGLSHVKAEAITNYYSPPDSYNGSPSRNSGNKSLKMSSQDPAIIGFWNKVTQ